MQSRSHLSWDLLSQRVVPMLNLHWRSDTWDQHRVKFPKRNKQKVLPHASDSWNKELSCSETPSLFLRPMLQRKEHSCSLYTSVNISEHQSQPYISHHTTSISDIQTQKLRSVPGTIRHTFNIKDGNWLRKAIYNEQHITVKFVKVRKKTIPAKAKFATRSQFFMFVF
jgi:hypothetical protein